MTGALLALACFDARADEPSPRLEVRKVVLDNGLTVLLSEDHRLPQVAVDVWYHVGAANQTPGKSGFAHLFEHMMFTGAKHIGPQPFGVLERIGVPAGTAANGSTGWDRTRYFEVVPKNQLPAALWLESDRMGFLLDTLDQKRLEVQRNVVSNERRQMYDNRAYGPAGLAICDALYPRPHPYYECVIGSIEEVQRGSLDEVRAFFRTYYTPNNASLALVGDFDSEQALALVRKYFGPLPRGPAVVPPTPQVSRTLPAEFELSDANARASRLSLVWPSVRPYDENEAAANVLAIVLGRGKASRLYRRLVLDTQLANKVEVESEPKSLGGTFTIEVTLSPGHSSADARAAVRDVVEELRAHGPTPAEVRRAARNVVADRLRGLQRIGGFGGAADLLNEYQVLAGDPNYLPKDLARYESLTAEQVQHFAATFLTEDRCLTVQVQPAAAPAKAP